MVAAYALLVGLTFGFNLWNPRDPVVTIVWLLIVAAPLWFYGLLYWSRNSRPKTTALFTVALVAIAAGIGDFVVH